MWISRSEVQRLSFHRPPVGLVQKDTDWLKHCSTVLGLIEIGLNRPGILPACKWSDSLHDSLRRLPSTNWAGTRTWTRRASAWLKGVCIKPLRNTIFQKWMCVINIQPKLSFVSGGHATDSGWFHFKGFGRMNSLIHVWQASNGRPGLPDQRSIAATLENEANSSDAIFPKFAFGWPSSEFRNARSGREERNAVNCQSFHDSLGSLKLEKPFAF